MARWRVPVPEFRLWSRPVGAHAARGRSGVVPTDWCELGWLRAGIQPMKVRYRPTKATKIELACHHGVALTAVWPMNRYVWGNAISAIPLKAVSQPRSDTMVAAGPRQ